MSGTIFLIDFSHFARVCFACAHVIHEVERRSQKLFAFGHRLRFIITRFVTHKIIRFIRLSISLVSQCQSAKKTNDVCTRYIKINILHNNFHIYLPLSTTLLQSAITGTWRMSSIYSHSLCLSHYSN